MTADHTALRLLATNTSDPLLGMAAKAALDELAAAYTEIERLKAVIENWERLSGGPGPAMTPNWSNPPTVTENTRGKT